MIQTRCSLHVVHVTHTVLFKAFLESNNVDDALHLFNVMRSKRFKPDKISFVGIVTALCAQGRIDEAVSTYRDIAIKYPPGDFQLDHQIPLMIMTKLGCTCVT